MPRALQFHVNRADHQDVEARTKRFVPEGPFVVRISNRGQGSHVHVSVTGELALDAGLPDDNPFLESGETLEVPVDVTTDLRPARGSVVVTTGYGRNEASVDVELRTADEGEPDGADAGSSTGQQRRAAGDAPSTGTGDDAGTAVAERLSAAAAGLRERAPSVDGLPVDADSFDGVSAERAGAVLPARPTFDAGTALLVALTLLALLAAGTVLQLFSGPVVTISVLAVVGTVLAAGVYLLLQ